MLRLLAATSIIIAQGTMTYMDGRYLDELLARRLAYGEIEEPVTGYAAYGAMRDPEWKGAEVAIECTNGSWLWPVLVIDCGAEHDLDYLDGIDFAFDIVGKDAWKSCVVPGKSAEVRVWMIAPRARWPARTHPMAFD